MWVTPSGHRFVLAHHSLGEWAATRMSDLLVFTNQAGNIAVGLTTDQAVAQRCPGGVTTVTKSRNPTLIEYDVQMAHPHAVALAVEIQEAREKERAA